MEIIPLSELDYFDYIQISGDDARSFLQGQVTCNVDLLSQQRSLVGALCNLKGRVIADFRLLSVHDDEILLQTLSGNGQIIIETLSRYAVFSKVELQLTDGPTAAFGVIGESVEAAFQEVACHFPESENGVLCSEDFVSIRVAGSKPRYQLWCRNQQALTAVRRLDVMEEQATLVAWQRADIEAGIVHVDAQSSERYTPQLLNYDISGAVDFNKGCYTGQEVVARMHYRATAKKRMFRLRSAVSIDTDSSIASASAAEQAVAEVLSSIPASENGLNSEALAILSTELAASNPQLVLAGEKVELVELTYPVE